MILLLFSVNIDHCTLALNLEHLQNLYQFQLLTNHLESQKGREKICPTGEGVCDVTIVFLIYSCPIFLYIILIISKVLQNNSMASLLEYRYIFLRPKYMHLYCFLMLVHKHG